MRFGIRELFFLLLLLGFPVLTYFFVFEPRNQEMVQAREEIRDKQAKLAKLELATASIDDLGHEIDKLEEAIALHEKQLPPRRDEQVILKEVWELAHKHDLQPRSVRTDKIIAAAHYAELPIKMVILGDFDGFYSFLLEVEKLPRITRMPTMTLKKVMNGKNEGLMQADVVLSIFFEGRNSSDQERRS